VFTAYIDESARRRASEAACVYTLAAVVVPDESIEKVQQAMINLRYRGPGSNRRKSGGYGYSPWSGGFGSSPRQIRDNSPISGAV
jgi:hypothetical protein